MNPDLIPMLLDVSIDPCDGSVHPSLQYVLIRGFSAMGWEQPQAASEDMAMEILKMIRPNLASGGTVAPSVQPLIGERPLCQPSRPDAGGGVRVKPLEWSVEARHYMSIHHGCGLGFDYEAAAKVYSSGWIVMLGYETIYNDNDGDQDSAKAAAQADYERRILSALSTPPAAVESNASVEARLREALEHYAKEYCEGWCEQDAGCANFDHDCGGCLARRALSAVGDEAKKSALSFKAAQNTAESDPSVTPDCLGADTGGRDSSSLPEGESDLSVTTGYLPPDPTAERREIVALADIAAERKRQIEAEGWTVGHDDRHTDGALAKAATCYASVYPLAASYWPWDIKWWKPKDRRRDLVRAGALIVAEIERLDRLAALYGGAGG